MKLKKILSAIGLFFDGKTNDEKVNKKLRFLRIFFWIGFGIIYLNVGRVFVEFPQSLNEADVFTGTVIGSRHPPKRSYTVITLMVDGVEVKFNDQGTDAGRAVKQQKGNIVTIWSFVRFDSYYRKVNGLLEAEVDGYKFNNNFERLKEIKASSHPVFWTFFGLGLLILTFPLIVKNLTKIRTYKRRRNHK